MDVHLRSTTVCALDAETGEAVARRFRGNPWGEVAEWMSGFPGLFFDVIIIPKMNPSIIEKIIAIRAIRNVTQSPWHSLRKLLPLNNTLIPIFCIANPPFNQTANQ